MGSKTAWGDCRKLPPGLLPILKAVATGNTDVDLSKLAPSTIRAAIRDGLGAVLAHVSRDCPTNSHSTFADDIRAADLTARLLTADVLDAIGHILRASDTNSCRPLLIKGAAMALLHYPAPHLRTMGDIDICIPLTHQSAFEAQLRALGFTQTSHMPAEFFERHHHSMPFWHPQWRVWVEVHTRLFPPQSPLAEDSRFALVSIEPQLQTLEVHGSPAWVMTSELQLLYASTRWLEELNVERGIFPMLDVVLLIRNQGHMLNWDQVFVMLEGSPSVITTAMHAMLAYLCRWDIISVPREVLGRLAAGDRHTNRASLWILHRMVTLFLIERRPFGRFLTDRNIRIIWSTLLRTPTPLRNLLSLPYRIAFPPGHPHRFQLAYAARRLRSFVRGAAK
jgi:hypothetical protein